jgi:hypothetical protein
MEIQFYTKYVAITVIISTLLFFTIIDQAIYFKHRSLIDLISFKQGISGLNRIISLSGISLLLIANIPRLGQIIKEDLQSAGKNMILLHGLFVCYKIYQLYLKCDSIK